MTGLKIERINTPEPMLNFLEETGIIDKAIHVIMERAKVDKLAGSPFKVTIATEYRIDVMQYMAHFRFHWVETSLSYTTYMDEECLKPELTKEWGYIP